MSQPPFDDCIQDDRVLIVVEGPDAAGKSTLAGRLASAIGSRTRIVRPSRPRGAGLDRGYLDRFDRWLPAKGEVVVLDRSWYSRAGIERVLGLATARQVADFYRRVVGFERRLARDGIFVAKLYLHVDPDVQWQRIARRIREPARFGPATAFDRLAPATYDEVRRAAIETIARTTKEEARWNLVNSNRWQPLAQILRTIFGDVSSTDFDGSTSTEASSGSR